MNVNFTPQAFDDLKSINNYIAQFDELAAVRVISRIRQSVMMLETFPLIGREGQVEENREFSIPGLPYIIVYTISSVTDVDVLTIIHERQQYP